MDIVKFLVENGADTSVEREGKTLIDIAVANGFQDIADYLKGMPLACLDVWYFVYCMYMVCLMPSEYTTCFSVW